MRIPHVYIFHDHDLHNFHLHSRISPEAFRMEYLPLGNQNTSHPGLFGHRPRLDDGPESQITMPSWDGMEEMEVSRNIAGLSHDIMCLYIYIFVYIYIYIFVYIHTYGDISNHIVIYPIIWHNISYCWCLFHDVYVAQICLLIHLVRSASVSSVSIEARLSTRKEEKTTYDLVRRAQHRTVWGTNRFWN